MVSQDSMNLKHCKILRSYKCKKVCSCQIHSKKVHAATYIGHHMLTVWRHKETACNMGCVRMWARINYRFTALPGWVTVCSDRLCYVTPAVVLENSMTPWPTSWLAQWCTVFLQKLTFAWKCIKWKLIKVVIHWSTHTAHQWISIKFGIGGMSVLKVEQV
jgi:hypothetical protein